MTVPDRPGDRRIQDNSFLKTLRTQTRPAHEELERLALSRALISPSLDLPSYITYLKLMYSVVADMEDHMYHTLGEIIPDLDSRRKSAKIVSDLRDLEQSIPQADFRPLSKLPGSDDPAFALGMFYVLEGSVLGGRFILKNVEQTLGLNAARGASYFSGYQAQTGKRWNEFLDTLTGFESKNQCGKRIIWGAESAFRAIYDHLTWQQSDSQA